jgi:hypothetical protein
VSAENLTGGPDQSRPNEMSVGMPIKIPRAGVNSMFKEEDIIFSYTTRMAVDDIDRPNPAVFFMLPWED